MNHYFDYELKKYEKILTVYILPFGFTVEVETEEEMSQFYILHKNYGDQMYMFGLYNRDITSYEDIIMANAIEYMHIYSEEYMIG